MAQTAPTVGAEQAATQAEDPDDREFPPVWFGLSGGFTTTYKLGTSLSLSIPLPARHGLTCIPTRHAERRFGAPAWASKANTCEGDCVADDAPGAYDGFVKLEGVTSSWAETLRRGRCGGGRWTQARS